MIRTIQLHGPLAETFGEGPYRFQANTFRELMAGMQMHHPTFRRELLKYDDLAVMLGDPETREHTFLTTEELGMSFGRWPELHIGVGKRGNAEGAAAVAAYFFQAGTTAYYIAYAVAYVAITVAVSYAVSAVIASLSDTPSTEDGERKQSKSDLFNGPDNRDAQGGRAQLTFGRFRVGTYTLSQSIEARRQAIGVTDSLVIEEGTTGTLNVFANDKGLVNPTVVQFRMADNTLVSAGGTYTGAGYTVSVAANGNVTFTSVGGSGGIETGLHMDCLNEGVPFDQGLALGVTLNYSYYDYNGGGGGGGGGGEGDGGGGGG